jgi:hypothetical protein
MKHHHQQTIQSHGHGSHKNVKLIRLVNCQLNIAPEAMHRVEDSPKKIYVLKRNLSPWRRSSLDADIFFGKEHYLPRLLHMMVKKRDETQAL